MKPLYVFRGKVREGKKRGRDLGYPTANISLRQDIPSGIYISLATFEGKDYPALTFIGEAKTFNETLFQAETYMLDFNKSMYNQWLSIKLLKKIRDNEKFTSAQALVNQIQEDEKAARSFFELPFPLNTIVIENKRGTYKDFKLPKNTKYPLRGILYPVDYGYLPGFMGEDNHELDFFVGSATFFRNMGYIQVSRPEPNILEHKFYICLTKEEVGKVLKTFQPVLQNHGEYQHLENLLAALEPFKIK